MPRPMSALSAVFFGVVLSMPLPITTPLPSTLAMPSVAHTAAPLWQSEHPDHVLIDTKKNVGYIVHANRTFRRFPVVTGQHRYVSYIGRHYHAKTPDRSWEARSIHTKGDRITFGPSGRFLRLYADGERTAYGFHEHRDEKEMFSREADERFRSMGCVIVETETMDLLADAFSKSDGSLPVTTIHGIEDVFDTISQL